MKAGQVVARLDPSLLQVQVDIQQANIERQQTDIDSQKVQLEDAKRSLTRTKELFDKGLANQTQLEQADLTVKTRDAQIASAQKQLVSAEANLAQAKLNLSYTEVKTPIDGVVVERRVDVGQTVQSSMNITPFFTIATDLTNLKLTAGVDEAEIGKIQPGMAVNFTVDSYAGQTFHGTVNAVRLNAGTQNNVVTYPVWIDAPNPDLKLRPSMTATVRIQISTANNVVRIPNQALRFRPTTDMYLALGLTPPAPTAAAGRRGGGNAGAAPAADAASPAPAATPARSGAPTADAPRQARQGQAPAAQGGQDSGGAVRAGQNAQAPGVNGGGRGNGGAGRGQGFGGGRGDFANLSPEERQRLMAQFGGGRGGNGQGGRMGARQGGRNGGQPAPTMASLQQSAGADKIDELFQPTPVRNTPGVLWTWDEANKKLTETRVVTGLTDGTFSQLVSGDVKAGMQVVTSIVVPLTTTQRNQQNNLFGQQGRGNFGGMMPGNGPGGPGGPGGFQGGGAPGGGGGGRGGR